MDLRQLRYFLEIVEQGSISRAALRLNVAQPALSTHIRNLEAELGTALLTRSRSGVAATEAGELLVRHARFMLSEQARSLEEIRHFAKVPTGEVRLGLPGTISEILAVPLIEKVAELYPGIRLTISEAMSGFVASWLRDGAIDLAVLYARPQDAALDCEALVEEELVCITAAHPLPQRAITMAELAELPLILPSRAHGLRQTLDTAAQRAGRSLNPAIEIDSYNNIKTLVLRGRGVAVLPHHAIARESALTARSLAPPLKRSAYLVHRANTPLPRTAAMIRHLLQEVAHRLIDDGQWLGAARGDAAP